MTTLLDTFILFSVTPMGFIAIMLLLTFFEYLIIKSIFKDAKIVIWYVKSRTSKIGIMLKNKKEIPSPIGVAINYVKINGWFG